jgi:hypothetical protein
MDRSSNDDIDQIIRNPSKMPPAQKAIFDHATAILKKIRAVQIQQKDADKQLDMRMLPESVRPWVNSDVAAE